MDFTLDKKHEMARSLFREFAENEVKPLAQEVDETEEFPVENVKKMQKLGFMGIPVPKEYGGQGCDPVSYTHLTCLHGGNADEGGEDGAAGADLYVCGSSLQGRNDAAGSGG